MPDPVSFTAVPLATQRNTNLEADLAESKATRLAAAMGAKAEDDPRAFAQALDQVLSENPRLYVKANMASSAPGLAATARETLAERRARASRGKGESFTEALDREIRADPDLYNREC